MTLIVTSTLPRVACEYGQISSCAFVATAFVSASNAHGGNESTILTLNNVFSHFGAVIVPTGYTGEDPYGAGGNPYGTGYPSGGATDAPLPDDVQAKARYQGERLAKIAGLLQPLRG